MRLNPKGVYSNILKTTAIYSNIFTGTKNDINTKIRSVPIIRPKHIKNLFLLFLKYTKKE